MCTFVVVCSMFVYLWVFSCVVIPLLPRPPMAVIVISMPFIIVVPIATMAVIGVFSISAMILVIRTFVIAMTTRIIELSFIVATIMGISIVIFRNHWRSSCHQEKGTQYGNNHSFHLTPPSMVMVFATCCFVAALLKFKRAKLE